MNAHKICHINKETEKGKSHKWQKYLNWKSIYIFETPQMVSVFLHSTLHYIAEGSSISISSTHTFLSFMLYSRHLYLFPLHTAQHHIQQLPYLSSAHLVLSTSAAVHCWQYVTIYTTGLSHSKQFQTTIPHCVILYMHAHLMYVIN